MNIKVEAQIVGFAHPLPILREGNDDTRYFERCIEADRGDSGGLMVIKMCGTNHQTTEHGYRYAALWENQHNTADNGRKDS